MKKVKNFEQFLNEELFGLSNEEKRKKADKLRQIQKSIELRNQVQREENDELFKTFYMNTKNEFDVTKMITHIGGGVENIKYNDSDRLIDKSPIYKREKENNDRGKNITYGESQSFDKKLFLTTVDGIKIYLMDSQYVRDNIDIDFTMGGHGYVYPRYIPEDEVWIDSRMNEVDRYATIVHELVERRYMKTMHWTYSKAHEAASKKEQEIRKRIQEKTN